VNVLNYLLKTLCWKSNRCRERSGDGCNV